MAFHEDVFEDIMAGGDDVVDYDQDTEEDEQEAKLPRNSNTEQLISKPNSQVYEASQPEQRISENSLLPQMEVFSRRSSRPKSRSSRAEPYSLPATNSGIKPPRTEVSSSVRAGISHPGRSRGPISTTSKNTRTNSSTKDDMDTNSKLRKEIDSYRPSPMKHTSHSKHGDLSKSIDQRDEKGHFSSTNKRMGRPTAHISNNMETRPVKNEAAAKKRSRSPADEAGDVTHIDKSRKVSSSNKRPGQPNGTRYFVMKSTTFDNVLRSQRDGIWATQESNAAKLNSAFLSSERAILIFSVNSSQHFQGYALMDSNVGNVKYDKWTNVSETNLGGNFKVKWLKVANLPFSKTSKLLNDWNEHLPVKRSRDGQELPADVGEKLCQLIDDVPKDGYPESASILAQSLPNTKQRKDTYVPVRNPTDDRFRGSPPHSDRLHINDPAPQSIEVYESSRRKNTLYEENFPRPMPTHHRQIRLMTNSFEVPGPPFTHFPPSHGYHQTFDRGHNRFDRGGRGRH